MADSYYDAARRGSRDWPDVTLADGVSPLNRIYSDSVTLPADLVRKFLKEEEAPRVLLVCQWPVVKGTDGGGAALPGVEHLDLGDGYRVLLQVAATVPEGDVKSRVVDVRGAGNAAEVARRVAESVNSWLPGFTAVAKGGKLGIYTSKGQSAVGGHNLNWAQVNENVVLMRPGFPPECLPGTYHPQCAFLVLVDARLTNSTDTHVTFGRRWQVDLARLDEGGVVDVDAMLRQGLRTSEQVEQLVAPPRQFLPWVKTITETLKTKRGTEAQATPGVAVDEADLAGSGQMQDAVVQDNLAAASRNVVRQEWAAPVKMVNREFDAEVGGLREVQQEVIRADDMPPLNWESGHNYEFEEGEDDDAEGSEPPTTEAVQHGTAYSSYQQVDPFWAIKTTVQASGLAGQARNGVGTRTYTYRDNYAWPRVLSYIDIQAVNSDPRDIYSPVTSYCWRPVWLREAFNGPCTCRVVERWTSVKPVLGGNPDWDTTKLGAGGKVENRAQAPLLPDETPMQPAEIEFRGRDLQIHIPECLHSGVKLRDSQFFQAYKPTLPTRWPATILARVTLMPDQGGWLTREFWVDAPAGDGRIELLVQGELADGFVLSWSGRLSRHTVSAMTLEVATDPSFNGGFVDGYGREECSVLEEDTPGGDGTALRRVTVTGVKRGLIYYARVKRQGTTQVGGAYEQDSNICVATTLPVPELTVKYEGRELSRKDESATDIPVVNLGNVELNARQSLTLPLYSAGLRAVHEIQAELLESEDEEENGLSSPWVLESPPVTLMPGQGHDLKISFAAGATMRAGEWTRVLRIRSNADEFADPVEAYHLLLTATVVVAGIQVNYGVSGPVVTDVVNFGTVTDPEGESVHELRISNSGSALLTDLTMRILPLDAGDDGAGPAAVDNSQDFRIRSLNDLTAENDTAVFSAPDLGPGESVRVKVVFNPVESDHASALRRVRLVLEGGGRGEVAAPVTLLLAGTTRLLNGPGSVDVSFTAGVPDGLVYAVALQGDGKVVLGGDFPGRLCRLNADGSVDESFTFACDHPVRALAVAGGLIYAGGELTQLWRTVDAPGTVVLCQGLAAMQQDGELAAGFTPPVMEMPEVLTTLPAETTAPPGTTAGPETTAPPPPLPVMVRCLAVQRDGRLLVGGEFDGVNSEPNTCGLVRLNADGSVDTGFVHEVDGPVHGLQVLADGSVLVVGNFGLAASPPTLPPTTAPPTTPPLTIPPTWEPPTPPPITDPPITDPPITDPPITDPPVTDPPVYTDPPTYSEPTSTEPPV